MFYTLSSTIRIIKLLLICFYFGIPFHFLGLLVRRKFSSSRKHIEKGESRLAQSFVKALQYSGPSFIKLGQVLSTRPDLTGDIFSEELAKLQDRLPPFSFAEVEKSLEAELHGRLRDNFQKINPIPVAAASIAQVHKAITHDGEVVAVKVLRPGIEKKFSQDLALFKFITQVICTIFPLSSRIKPHEILKILADTVKFELDLRYEGASADTIRDNSVNDQGVRIPKVYWQLSGKRVLTMEWIDGIPVHERDKLIEAGHDLHEISRKLAVTFFNQAYRDGFFHADLHPGNIFVDKNGDIALVDFGIIGILAPSDRLLMAEILYGFITRDYKRVSDIHFTAGYVPRTQDATQFALACRSIGEPIIGMPVNRVSLGRLLKQLFEVSATFDMVLQTQLLLLQKTLITIEGVGLKIYPEVNMWKLAEPWIKSWAKDNFGLKGKFKSFKRQSLHAIDYLPSLMKRLDHVVELSEAFLSKKTEIPKKKCKWKDKFLGFAIGLLTALIVVLLNKI